MSFRGMRRSAQQMSEEKCIHVLTRNTAGVLATLGDEGYPYAVPLSYVFADGKIYFHCAKMGHKMDAIIRCPKVSFCVVDQDQVVPEKYTTYFRSVIAFGKARVMEDPGEIREAIEKLAVKYAPHDIPKNRNEAIDREIAHMAMVVIDIEHMTGKEARELVRRQEN